MGKLIYRKITANLYRKKSIKPSIFQQFDPSTVSTKRAWNSLCACG
jgi:hypothetical protein